MPKKPRVLPSKKLAVEVMWRSDSQCCVCETDQHPQIHHIDGDPSNNTKDNLAVLCLEHHAQTQDAGGFSRRLTPDLITRYRNEWLTKVSEVRKSMKELPIDEETKRGKAAHVLTLDARFTPNGYGQLWITNEDRITRSFRVKVEELSNTGHFEEPYPVPWRGEQNKLNQWISLAPGDVEAVNIAWFDLSKANDPIATSWVHRNPAPVDVTFFSSAHPLGSFVRRVRPASLIKLRVAVFSEPTLPAPVRERFYLAVNMFSGSFRSAESDLINLSWIPPTLNKARLEEA